MDREWADLIRTGVYHAFRSLGIEILEMAHFCSTPRFWEWWVQMKLGYGIRSPYSFAAKEGAGLLIPKGNLIYGETPLLTAYQLLDWSGVPPGSMVVDLSGGTGKFVFAANLFKDMKGTGVDILPSFARINQGIADAMGLTGVRFLCSDFLTTELWDGDLYYLSGTTFARETLEEASRWFAHVKSGAAILSLSTPISGDHLVLEGERVYSFSWGNGHVYLQKRK
ncbi:MAG: hypothetical protein HYU64_19135 [Armatimonadetes bacterium]|nr:hypothetical protein [Armatimonadota bacterium]